MIQNGIIVRVSSFLLVVAGLLAPIPVFSQAEPETTEATKDRGTSITGRWDYLRREDVTQRKDYTRLSLFYDGEGRFLHPRGGTEVRVTDSQLRCYWLGNDIRIDDRAAVRLRLNHTEFGDYRTAINYASAYYTYRRWWLRLGVGLGYSSIVLDEDAFQDPLLYRGDAIQSRFIYEVSLCPSLLNDRLELDVGFRNFDDFEYHGFDDNGYHVQPILHLSENTSVSYFYERRYAGAFISLPTLARTTWMVSIEHRF